MGNKILIFGAVGDPSAIDPNQAYTNDPRARTVPIICNDTGVPYVQLIAGSSIGPAPVELFPWVTNADASAVEGLRVLSFPYVLAGGASDNAYRTAAVAAANMNPAPGSNPQGGVLTGDMPEWALTHEPAVATRATITRAAVADTRHVCRSVSATFCCAAADVATGAILRLRDGATGAGTILRSWRLHVMDAAGGTLQVDIAGLNIAGSVNTAMTLEFAAAPGAASFQSVGISGISPGV